MRQADANYALLLAASPFGPEDSGQVGDELVRYRMRRLKCGAQAVTADAALIDFRWLGRSIIGVDPFALQVLPANAAATCLQCSSVWRASFWRDGARMGRSAGPARWRISR